MNEPFEIKLPKFLLAPEITEIEFLEQAYDWYKDYLIWEDKNIDEDINSKLN